MRKEWLTWEAEKDPGRSKKSLQACHVLYEQVNTTHRKQGQAITPLSPCNQPADPLLFWLLGNLYPWWHSSFDNCFSISHKSSWSRSLMCLHTLRLHEAFCSQNTTAFGLWVHFHLRSYMSRHVFQAPTKSPDKYATSQCPTNQSME